MHAEPQPDFSDLPSIDDTIAAMSVLGRILDELRSKLAVSEQTVARLAKEKSTLQKELWAIVDFASAQRVRQTKASVIHSIASNATRNELFELVKSIDASFGTRKRLSAH